MLPARSHCQVGPPQAAPRADSPQAARALRRCRLPYDERVQVHADDDAARRVCLRAHGRRKLDGEVSERQGRVLRKLPHSGAIYLATRCYSVLYTFENALSGHECQICFDSCEGVLAVGVQDAGLCGCLFLLRVSERASASVSLRNHLPEKIDGLFLDRRRPPARLCLGQSQSAPCQSIGIC